MGCTALFDHLVGTEQVAQHGKLCCVERAASEVCGGDTVISKEAIRVTTEFMLLVGIGFVAQLVDGALGMAYGVLSNTALLTIGLPPLGLRLSAAHGILHPLEIGAHRTRTTNPRRLDRGPRICCGISRREWRRGLGSSS